ncbi:McrB family protein [Candidatus Pristimantibacillus sp. PTI5]|uniref:McrB family protein n=1 Tax=Candidatus Pristimantibacillus sp. PTI5 TaxID=3400422 RepID=UPI003B028108
MIKQIRSWWKDSTIPNLIGRKRVDWSVFEYGSHIPMEFHSDFLEANKGEVIPLGQSEKVELLYNGQIYSALLMNINQKSADRAALQLRYDSNKDLRAFMMHAFKTTHDYISSQRSDRQEAGKKEQIKVPDEQSEYIEFYSTGIPYQYGMKLLSTNQMQTETSSVPKIWWVNQGMTLSEEQEGGLLWAPFKSSNGRSQYHWDTMDEVRPGDIVLHYANGALRSVSNVLEAAIKAPKPETMVNTVWEQTGRLVKVEYVQLEPFIPLTQFASSIMGLEIAQGPIHSGGGVKQGYLFRFTAQALQIIQDKSSGTNWPEFTQLNYTVTLSLEDVEDPLPMNDNQVKAAIQEINSYIRNKGFHFPDDLIENLYLSLKTKPFVILAGVSGTGKTKLVKLFAEALGALSHNHQFALIPVRPDWSDPSDLLGYKDLSGAFRPGRLAEVLVEASQESNRHKPYFICLDEMNLARVEHYFSDLLSIIETQEWQGDRIVTMPLINKDTLAAEDQPIYGNLSLSDNVYLIGTVNMDETTHPFSKKVLDRANTIEFNYINLEQFPDQAGATSEAATTEATNAFLRSEYLQLIDAYGDYQGLVKQVTAKLVKVNSILEQIHSHVGFRIRDAVCFYMIYNERFSLMSEDDAFDLQLLQKILPRVQGSSSSVKRVLLLLMQEALGKALSVNNLMDDASDLYMKWIANEPEERAKYPMSARKIAFMLRRLEEDGFTSYWLS